MINLATSDRSLLHYRHHIHLHSKETVVMIHGLGGSLAMWFKQYRELKKHFNVLLIDLPGHGKSLRGLRHKNTPGFIEIAYDILSVLDQLSIQTAHFVGMSLGSIITQVVQDVSPCRVSSMILGGSVEGVYRPIVAALKIVERCKGVLPYMWVYRFCARVLMPRKHHVSSRKAFVKEAIILGHDEFFAWLRVLSRQTNRFFKQTKLYKKTPVLYLMGSEDYMFLPLVETHMHQWSCAKLIILQGCGHVCNLESVQQFNKHAIGFIYEHATTVPKTKTV